MQLFGFRKEIEIAVSDVHASAGQVVGAQMYIIGFSKAIDNW